MIGPILDTVGAKPTLAVGLSLIAAAMAILPSLVSYPEIAAAALAYGFGGGILNTATNAAISDLGASGRGVALNLLGFSFSLGAFTAPLLISVAARSASIPSVVRILAIAPAIVLTVILTLRFPAPAHSGTPLRSLVRVLNHPLVWLFGVLLFFESGSENCMFVWAGRLVRDMLHLATARADLALVALSVALGTGRLLAALWLKWLGSRNMLLLSATITMAGAIVVLIARTFGGMVAGFALMGLGMSSIFPTTMGLVGDRFPNQTGTVFGAVMTLAVVGGASGPLVGGWAASSGPEIALTVPLVAGAAVMVLTLIVSSPKPLSS